MSEENPKYLLYWAGYTLSEVKELQKEFADKLGLGLIIAKIRPIPKTELIPIKPKKLIKSPEVTKC